MNRKVILSGMRPTGRLHLGNVLGALTNWVKLQSEPNTRSFYMVADWHALTTEYQNTSKIESNIEEMVLDWIAGGLDPEKAVIFRQSWVREHAELSLLLSMITPISWLERNPTYKEQMVELKEKEISTHGFLGYPVLQAADILIYGATHVPVGEDQLPHLELTREIARRFNHIYKKTILVEPQAIISAGSKVLGIDGRKMSKSYDNCIYFSETEAETKKKVSSLFTDPKKIRANDPGHPVPCPENPTGCVVFSMHGIYGPDPAKLTERENACRSGELGCVQCKQELFESMNRVLEPQREKRRRFSLNKNFVKDLLTAGSKEAQKTASKTFHQVMETIHFKTIT